MIANKDSGKDFFQKKSSKALFKYGTNILIIYLITYITYEIMYFAGLFHPFELIIANISFFIGKLFYPQLELTGNIISNILVFGQDMDFSIKITEACLGWFSMAAFAALILGLPGISRNKKIKSLLIGLPAIQVINILRIVSLFFAADLGGFKGFDFVHLVLVRFDLFLFVLLLYFGCIYFIIGKKEIKKILN